MTNCYRVSDNVRVLSSYGHIHMHLYCLMLPRMAVSPTDFTMLSEHIKNVQSQCNLSHNTPHLRVIDNDTSTMSTPRLTYEHVYLIKNRIFMLCISWTGLIRIIQSLKLKTCPQYRDPHQTSYWIRHSPYFIRHSPYFIRHTSYFITSNKKLKSAYSQTKLTATRP